MSALIAAGIPSPSQGIWYLGPIPLRAYGIIIAAGMIVGVWWTARRYRDRGGNPDTLYDAALWAIPLGVVGARIYHVITSPDAYFGPGGDPMLAFQIWRGGLGIWGGVAFGALGVYIAVKRAGVRLGPIADSLAPALLIAQAIGRWGNWFNQELFGAPTTLPWGLQIDAAHMPAGYPAGTLFHPTFLYECLWNLAAAALIVWLDRRHRFAGGQVFGLYLMAYTAGRCWIEMLRIDDAHRVLGLRLNVWTSLLVFALGLLVFVVAGRLGRSTRVVPDDSNDEAEASSDEEDTQASADKADTDTLSSEVVEESSDDADLSSSRRWWTPAWMSRVSTGRMERLRNTRPSLSA